MASVFLSYAREDRPKAEALASALEGFGHSVWWDRSIEGGSRFSQEIEQALKRSDAVVVMWSHLSIQSAWVTDEAAEGRDTGRLVPVVIDESKPPLGFRQYQAIDLSRWKQRAKDAAIDGVHRAILARAGGAGCPERSTKPRPVAPDYRRIGIAAAAVAFLAVAALVYWLAWPVAPADRGALRLRLGNFTVMSQDVPRTVPHTFREEVLAALATDAVIVATDEKAVAGSKPGFALTASIRKVQDMLRFTVHVVNERSGASIWTETLDRRAATDVAPRQVAVAVSQVLRCGLGGAARHRKPLPDETLSVWFNYCEEYWADTLGRKMNATRAVDLARRLTEAAPDFSRGWSGLAQVSGWAVRGNRMVDQEALRADAVRAAERALKLDKDNSEAYQALAALQPPFAYAAREKLHLKSISVSPSDCGCEYVGYGAFLYGVGRISEAVDAFKRAHDMIPLSADVNANWAEALFVAGRPADARQVVADVHELWPDYADLRETLLRVALRSGGYDEASTLLNDPKTPLSEPEREVLGTAVQALRSGNAASKANVATRLQDLARDRSSNGPLLITALARLGADQQALSLAAARVQRDGRRGLPLLFEPALAAARRTPQFAQIAQRFGLVSYWRQSRKKPDFCKEATQPALCASL